MQHSKALFLRLLLIMKADTSLFLYLFFFSLTLAFLFSFPLVCPQDNDAHFAMAGKYEVSLKPHGHGDVHSLLHTSGLAAHWAKHGVKWIVFFQARTRAC